MAHIAQFRDKIFGDTSYHVFGVAESSLGPVVDSNIIDIDGYSCVRQDRNTPGGGIVLYVRNFLRPSVLDRSDTIASCNLINRSTLCAA